jgi:TolB protein
VNLLIATDEDRNMSHFIHSVSRRPILTGMAGIALAAAARAPVYGQSVPQQAPQGPGQSAVIDVNRARSAPIPIAIPDFSAAGDATSSLR